MTTREEIIEDREYKSWLKRGKSKMLFVGVFLLLSIVAFVLAGVALLTM